MKEAYTEPIIDIVQIVGTSDVVTLSTGTTGTPDSDNFDEMFGTLS